MYLKVSPISLGSADFFQLAVFITGYLELCYLKHPAISNTWVPMAWINTFYNPSNIFACMQYIGLNASCDWIYPS